jgi:hypothetical protein
VSAFARALTLMLGLVALLESRLVGHRGAQRLKMTSVPGC